MLLLAGSYLRFTTRMSSEISRDNGARVSIVSVPASTFRTAFSHILNMEGVC